MNVKFSPKKPKHTGTIDNSLNKNPNKHIIAHGCLIVMKPKINTISLLILLTTSLFCFTAYIQVAKAQGTITIHSDGTFSPSSAHLVIIEPEGERKYYTFTSNISDSTIVVQKDNVIIDGAGYSLLGNSDIDTGIELQDVTGNRVTGLNIEGFQNGIKIIDGGACQIFENTITKNVHSGIEVSGTTQWNNILRNTIKDNDGAGISLTDNSAWSTVISNKIELNHIGIQITDMSQDNTIANNAFIDNALQFGDYNNQENRWNGDYGDSNGNYWSDYESRGYLLEDSLSGENQDLDDPDGIWDHPYFIYPEANVTDRYPLVERAAKFTTTITCSPGNISKINVYFDDDLRITGHITPLISDAIVNITIISNATNSQVEEVSVRTDKYSGYEYLLENIGYPLEFEIEASWDGSSTHYGAESGVFSFETYWDEQPEEGKAWWEILLGDIPGFPFESIIIGLLLALGLIYMSKKKSTDTFRAPK